MVHSTLDDLTLPEPGFPEDLLRRVPSGPTGTKREVRAMARRDDALAVTDRLPPRLERFELGKRLGVGATSEVFEALDVEDRRVCALKVQRAGRGVSPTAGTVLDNERRILQYLVHPNVVELLSSGTLEDGRRWLSLTLLRGGDLAALLARLAQRDPELLRAWPMHRRLRLFLSLCSGVEHLHSLGMIHRDIKPRNILLDTEGAPHLADFGLAGARTSRHDSDEPAPPSPGTPGYMAPEQIDPRIAGVDERSDLWALGSVLHELLFLKRAISGRTMTERVSQTLVGERVPPSNADKLSPALVKACMRALATRPEDRYSTVGDLAVAVGAANLPPPRR